MTSKPMAKHWSQVEAEDMRDDWQLGRRLGVVNSLCDERRSQVERVLLTARLSCLLGSEDQLELIRGVQEREDELERGRKRDHAMALASETGISFVRRIVDAETEADAINAALDTEAARMALQGLILARRLCEAKESDRQDVIERVHAELGEADGGES